MSWDVASVPRLHFHLVTLLHALVKQAAMVETSSLQGMEGRLWPLTKKELRSSLTKKELRSPSWGAMNPDTSSMNLEAGPSLGEPSDETSAVSHTFTAALTDTEESSGEL